MLFVRGFLRCAAGAGWGPCGCAAGDNLSFSDVFVEQNPLILPQVVTNELDLEKFLSVATKVAKEHPVVISKFIR